MSNCPECGLPPTATTQDDANNEAFYECQNMHMWPVEPPVDPGPASS